MNKKSLFFLILALKSAILPLKAQFYTITADTSKHSVNVVTMEKKGTTVGYIQDGGANYSNKTGNIDEEFFVPARGCEVQIERDVPVFVSVKDSMMRELLHDRLNVCLPLDLLKVNSNYGYRTDPILQCTRFHDGIDLNCHYANVYSMLPAIVRKVAHSNKGYGNHVVLEHGNVECLYGHLSTILVKEGELIPAGTIVAISGNTGKSTGPHLHVRIRKDGRSVNPKPFIDYLNDYITRLQNKIHYLKFDKKPPLDLNINNLAMVLEQQGVSHPRIVIAQALLETGYFTSRVCLEKNNLFGLRRLKDGSYYEFDNWEESVKAYRDYVQYKYKGGDYYQFLQRIGYAEDPDYVTKVRQIVRQL